MPRKTSQKRWIPISVIAVVWLAVGMTAPLLINVSDNAIEPETGSVVAAPRHSFTVSTPYKLVPELGLTLADGALGLSANSAAGRTLNQRDALIASGQSELVMEGGTLALFGAIAANANGATPPEMRGPEAPIASAIRSRKFKSISLKSGSVRIALPNGRAEEITNAAVVITPGSQSAYTVVGKGTWRGREATFEIAQSAAPAAEAANDKEGATDAPTRAPRSNVTFKLNSEPLSFAFAGVITASATPHMTGTATIKAKTFAAMADLVGGEFKAGNAVRDVEISGKTDWREDRLVFESARLRLGEHEATGGIVVAHKDDRPAITGTLDFQSFDIGPFLRPSGATGAFADATDVWSRLWSLVKAPFSKAVDFDLRMSAEALSLDQIALGRSAMTLRLHDGIFRGQFAEFRLADGLGTGEVSVDFNKPRSNFSFQGKIDNVDLGQLSQSLPEALRMAIGGRGGIRADVTTSGETMVDMITSLAGNVRVRMPKGAVVGVDLPKLAELKGPSDVAKLTGASDVKSLKSEIVFFNGTAFCRSLIATTPSNQISASGALNLSSGEISISTKFTPHPKLQQADTDSSKPVSKAPEPVVIDVDGTLRRAVATPKSVNLIDD
ncbi:MAG: AsmA-like C-terminal region-containing protein [Pseudomonadota bacterium]